MQELPGAKPECFQQQYSFIHGKRKVVAAPQHHVWNKLGLVKEITLLHLKAMRHILCLFQVTEASA